MEPRISAVADTGVDAVGRGDQVPGRPCLIDQRPDRWCGSEVSVPDSASTASSGATGATSASGAASCAGEGVPLVAIDEDRIAGEGRRAARARAASTTSTSGAGRAASPSSASSARSTRSTRSVAGAGATGSSTEQ